MKPEKIISIILLVALAFVVCGGIYVTYREYSRSDYYDACYDAGGAVARTTHGYICVEVKKLP